MIARIARFDLIEAFVDAWTLFNSSLVPSIVIPGLSSKSRVLILIAKGPILKLLGSINAVKHHQVVVTNYDPAQLLPHSQ